MSETATIAKPRNARRSMNVEQHRIVSAEVAKIGGELAAVETALVKAYKTQGADSDPRPVRVARQAVKALENLRSELNNRYSIEGHLQTERSSPYYPPKAA